jgi:FKBP-type peptidyl-prolyl cis-trans isomerase SlyD
VQMAKLAVSRRSRVDSLAVARRFTSGAGRLLQMERCAPTGRRGRLRLPGLLAATVAVLLSTTAVRSAEKGKDASLEVADGKRVSIEYTLRLEDETLVDTNVGGTPLTYTHGGNELLPALQSALSGLKAGDSKDVKLAAKDGYGPVEKQAFIEVGKDRIPEGAQKVGSVLEARDPAGQAQPVRVHEVKDETVVLDFNHPLAGKTLVFHVKVVGVEDAAE